VNFIMNVVIAFILASMLGVLLSIADVLGPMTFKLECHYDEGIERSVCFVMPIDDLIVRDMPEEGDNA